MLQLPKSWTTHWDCTNNTACNKCGGDQRLKDCKSEKKYCSNCGNEHYASARTCQYLKNQSKVIISSKFNTLNNNNIETNHNLNFSKTLSNQNANHGSYSRAVRGSSEVNEADIGKMIETKLFR